jgi:hypothetical protein
MGLSVFLVLFAVAVSAIVFVLARRRVSLGGAAALSAVAFLAVAGIVIVWLQMALGAMNG